MKSKLILLVIMAMALLVLLSGTASANPPVDDPEEAEAFGVVDGQKIALRVGSVLGQGTLRDSKCVFGAPVTVGAQSPNGTPGLVIGWAVDEECRVVVQEIRPGQEGDTGTIEDGQSDTPTPSRAEQHQQTPSGVGVSSSVETQTGWVSYYIGEQFDLPATQVYAEMGYDDYGDSVGRGHNPYARCWTSSFPKWTIEDCYSSYYPDGPDYVWIEVTGEFSHTLGIEYTQYAQWYGTSNGYSYRCTLTEGSLPPLWKEFCYGGVID